MRDDLVGVRLAGDVRCAGRVRHQLPVPLLLDGRRVPALGLAVLSGGRHLPPEQGPAAAGAALGYATLLRIFPVFVFSGPLLAGLSPLRQHRALDPRYTRFFLGAALAVLVLVPLPGRLGRRARLPAVRGNTIKHKETPLTNLMGLRTVIAWRPAEVGRFLEDASAVDPWGRWKRARRDAYRQARPLYLAVVVGFLALLAGAVRRPGAVGGRRPGGDHDLIGVELTSYYYAFILGLALAVPSGRSRGVICCCSPPSPSSWPGRRCRGWPPGSMSSSR